MRVSNQCAVKYTSGYNGSMNSLQDTQEIQDSQNCEMASLDKMAIYAHYSSTASECELAHLLVAMERKGEWWKLGYRSLSDYGQRRLGVDPGYLFGLLSLARDLSAFPRLARAWREGAIVRSKLREILRVMTPDTEALWDTFARNHTWRAVQRRVAHNPRARSGRSQWASPPCDTQSEVERGKASSSDRPNSATNAGDVNGANENAGATNENGADGWMPAEFLDERRRCEPRERGVAGQLQHHLQEGASRRFRSTPVPGCSARNSTSAGRGADSRPR